ncbi:MAG: hypothetical protein GOMPHAMPRED_007911 [Gomphillus americanus]|uniref:N-acetyltransferase domain-containing protein n=1 Tax=Gomphillus americanus TaxID=1940652 RepID=A0A8H3I3B5_9LECA|nr:MAG: hypothetical protein GOMPHAMPRED_007911 [Gomphillus americanus]
MTTVTTVKESEYDEWAEIWRQYLEFYETTLPQDQYKNTWSRIHKPDGDIRALVARDDQGKIIGLSHYLFLSSPWSAAPLCLLNDLFVNPNIRGKGIGRALIVATGEKAEERGCRRMQWTTKHDNYTAQKLYDTMGISDFKQYRMDLPYKK